MRVDAERRGGIRVAKAFAHRSYRDAGLEEMRSDVVTEIVEPDPLQTELVAQAHETPCRARVRPPWFPSLGIAREHVRLRRHLDVAGSSPLLCEAALGAQSADGHLVKRQAASPIRLGLLYDYPV